MQISIKQLNDKESPYLQNVQDLADGNTATLGFLPATAFKEYAARGGILVAVTDDEQLAGYVLYRIVKKKQQATITHLCVASQFRGLGIARRLFDELRQRSQMLRGIGLLCRRDFVEVNKVWESLGFHPQNEKDGRGKEPSTLTFWWYDHGHKSLFDTASFEKHKVAFDMNIFIDFQSVNGDKASLALRADWLQDDICLVRTPELMHEINRNQSAVLRQKNWAYASEFPETKDTEGRFDEICKELQPIFGQKTRVNDESDLKQVAWAIADNEVNFFVTRDDGILELGPIIYESFWLTVLDPMELILLVDELSRIEEYQQTRFAGTDIVEHRVQHDEIEYVADSFQNPAKERRSTFLKTIRRYLINPEAYTGCVIEHPNDKPQIFIIYDRSVDDELNIPVLRVSNGCTTKLLRYLLFQIVSVSSEEYRKFTIIADPNLHDATIKAIQEEGFVGTSRGWTKTNLMLAADVQTVANEFAELTTDHRKELIAHHAIYQKLLNDTNIVTSPDILQDIERMFWPLKIYGAGIPALSIPINTDWASMWFDSYLANQTLFGAQRDRALNREGVYYSAANRPNIATLPGRILWYVTKDVRVAGTMALRACSTLDVIEVGKPLDLYRKFQHLGIYELREVQRLVNGNLDREIVAYKFSDTQLFQKPVALAEWDAISTSEVGKHPSIYSPSKMAECVFERIYKLGMQLE